LRFFINIPVHFIEVFITNPLRLNPSATKGGV